MLESVGAPGPECDHHTDRAVVQLCLLEVGRAYSLILEASDSRLTRYSTQPFSGFNAVCLLAPTRKDNITLLLYMRKLRPRDGMWFSKVL